ncbi:MAG: ABC transporter permease, partial [Clostridiales bacterium]|nr:ABC transporter permease [Clostridiales bacterium]
MRIRTLAAKAAQMLLLFLLLVVLVFFLSRLAPGDPLRAYYGQSVERMSPSARAAAEQKLGLDQPLAAQFVIWAKNALSGDFGISFQYKQDVLTVVGGRWQNTLVLGSASFLLTFALAIPLGIYCASHAGSFADRLLCRLGAALSCIPVFFLALLLIAVFSVQLGLLPSSGAYPVGATGSALGRLRHLVLPALTIALGHFWHYAYLVRSRLLGELESEYVLFLRAKG